jgi:hypothetical protein
LELYSKSADTFLTTSYTVPPLRKRYVKDTGSRGFLAANKIIIC